jgi:hypothetical protein
VRDPHNCHIAFNFLLQIFLCNFEDIWSHMILLCVCVCVQAVGYSALQDVHILSE